MMTLPNKFSQEKCRYMIHDYQLGISGKSGFSFKENIHPSLTSLGCHRVTITRFLTFPLLLIELFNPLDFSVNHLTKDMFYLGVKGLLHIKNLFIIIKLVRDFNFTNFLLIVFSPK
ncbi:hypothetical protein HanRHA438_Chr16g0778061 [Helianthus annuus]|nr:hypothetical protein HanRHA438_Chr16g0778061 [Helianthus annuus]